MSRIVKVKNADVASRTWLGQSVSSGEYYVIPTTDLDDWSSDDTLLIDITDGYAIINDGSDDISGISAQIDWLKGVDPEKRTTDGRLIMALTKPDYSEVKIYSHNFADKTTWYADSVRDNLELLIDIGGGRFVSDHRNWIDITHGKIPQEDTILATVYDYRPYIYVYNSDGEELDGYEEEDPHFGLGQYCVDYNAGEVTFHEDCAPGNDGYVKSIYSYATTSTVYIIPSSGKELALLRSEAQFTTDIVMKDTIVFQLFVYTSVIEAALDLPPGTLGPEGSKYPYTTATKYKSVGDFIAEANGNFPICPPFGGSSWRGMRHSMITLPFDYNALKVLKDSLGAEVRVWLEHHEPHEGTFGTVTFYCYSKNEE